MGAVHVGAVETDQRLRRSSRRTRRATALAGSRLDARHGVTHANKQESLALNGCARAVCKETMRQGCVERAASNPTPSNIDLPFQIQTMTCLWFFVRLLGEWLALLRISVVVRICSPRHDDILPRNAWEISTSKLILLANYSGQLSRYLGCTILNCIINLNS